VKPGFGLPIEVRVATGRLTLHLPGVGQDETDEAEEADDDHDGFLNACFGPDGISDAVGFDAVAMGDPGDLALGSPAIGLGHGIDHGTEDAQHKSGTPGFGGGVVGKGGAYLQRAHRVIPGSGPAGPHTFV
jgi:hypothetical protein